MDTVKPVGSNDMEALKVTSITAAKRSNALPPPPPDVLSKELGISTITIDWLAGDGSDRCYYRLRSPEFASNPELTSKNSALITSMVLMQLSGVDAEALRKNGYEWIEVSNLLTKHGIFVPQVIRSLPDYAALIIEDYGDQMLETMVHNLWEHQQLDSIVAAYQQSFHVLATLLKIPFTSEQCWTKRQFDQERLEWELDFFLQKYLDTATDVRLSSKEKDQWDREKSLLSKVLAANSKYFVHRDFHSRNIMVLEENMAIIDFQDARLGPAAYDLVSLVFDSYVPFPAAIRSRLFQDGLTRINQLAGPSAAHDIEQLWRPTLLHRQLKAIGSFAYLTLDKKRGDYLRYVDPALRTLEEQNVLDERWPLISGVLLQKMRAFINRQHHQK